MQCSVVKCYLSFKSLSQAGPLALVRQTQSPYEYTPEDCTLASLVPSEMHFKVEQSL